MKLDDATIERITFEYMGTSPCFCHRSQREKCQNEEYECDECKEYRKEYAKVLDENKFLYSKEEYIPFSVRNGYQTMEEYKKRTKNELNNGYGL